jgi:two-component system, OmpR family, phosphate regulon sensor histidine kinase PhoR
MLMMAALVLALAVLALLLRQWHLGRMLADLEESAKSRKPALLEKHARLGIGRRIESLHRELNALIAQSMTDRDRDRNYLRQIEMTLGSIREAVLIVDEDNCVCMANKAARALLGTDRQLAGRRVEGLLPSVTFLDYMHELRESHTPGAELVEIVKGVDHLWFEVTGAVINEEGRVNKLYLFVLHDITKLKALENMRTEFVANVSHELRTPVTVIRGFTDTLIEEGDQLSLEERQRFLGKIQRNVVRLNSLLEDLLTLSRLEGRAVVLKTEPLSLNKIVQEACGNILDRKPADCALDLDLDAAVPVIELDALRITQVLENLLDNAIRHARGMTRMCIKTRLKDGAVTCSVEDNGCGIPPADVPHIFERFYRVDKGRSRELGGTGLGLSIVKHTIMQHGGTVFVESRVGQGTTIGFELPLKSVAK